MTSLYSIESIKNQVLTSNSDDWACYDENGLTYINKLDVRLQIKQKIKEEKEEFSEPFTDRFPDKSAFFDDYEVFFEQNKACEFLQVVVDGGRVSLPLPNRDTLMISNEQYIFGKLIHEAGPDRLHNFDEFIQQAGISVQN